MTMALVADTLLQFVVFLSGLVAVLEATRGFDAMGDTDFIVPVLFASRLYAQWPEATEFFRPRPPWV